MADKIDGLRPSGPQVSQTRTGGAGSAGARGASEGGGAERTMPVVGDRVELTDSARRIQALEARIADMPDVDEARVAEVRERIAEGRFEIDADRIAERLLAAEKQLP